MTDTQTDSTASPDSAPPSLLVNAQYIRDLSFENPNAPDSLRGQDTAPQVDIGVDVQARAIGDKIYEVILALRAEAKQPDDGGVAFLVELSYGGVFTLQGGFAEDMIEPVLFIEGPRMLFPFARSIVANASREGGFPPLMIHPIDFMQLYRQQRENQTSADGKDAPKEAESE